MAHHKLTSKTFNCLYFSDQNKEYKGPSLNCIIKASIMPLIWQYVKELVVEKWSSKLVLSYIYTHIRYFRHNTLRTFSKSVHFHCVVVFNILHYFLRESGPESLQDGYDLPHNKVTTQIILNNISYLFQNQCILPTVLYSFICHQRFINISTNRKKNPFPLAERGKVILKILLHSICTFHRRNTQKQF